MKSKKSLCESCSNRVVISFHGKYNGKKIKPNISDGSCYYEFKVSADIVDKYESIHEGIKFSVSTVIVDKCSFYNKSLTKSQKKKATKSDDSDLNDYGTDSKGNRMYGATFTNIPGALLP